MKKLLLLATTLLLSVSNFASQTEYVNDKYCIYEINVGDQTAKVVNFYSTASSVIIPESFIYQGDKYTVTSLGYKDFEARVREDWFGNTTLESYGKYSYEDYEKNRACIVELILPKTLKYIEGTFYDKGALSGLTRLKKITIPKSVGWFNSGWFGGNSRLESITFEGPICYEYQVKDVHWNYHKRTTCLVESDNPTAILDSMKMELREYKCPKLQKIDVLPLKEYLPYANRLKDTISVYEQKLKQHPYYIESEKGYFRNIKMSPTSNNFKESYNNALKLCREKYSSLMSEMENICKMKKPELYAEKYCALHPEFSAKIDALYNDYKCKYTKKQLAQFVLENKSLGDKCQDELWRKYSYLYKSKEAFLKEYNMASNISNHIRERFIIHNDLKDLIKNNQKPTKGLYDSSELFKKKCDLMKLYKIPFGTQIIDCDPKAVNEYAKNGKYFANPNEFFSAYITKDYSQILKAKKKASK